MSWLARYMPRRFNKALGLRGIIPKANKWILLNKFQTRKFAVAAVDPNVRTMPMLCMQCEQTSHGSGCTTQGICGKVPETSNLQDLLLDVNNSISQYLTRIDNKKVSNSLQELIRHHFLESTFSTLTNVNFDEERMAKYLQLSCQLRDELQKIYRQAVPTKQEFEKHFAASFTYNKDLEYLLKESYNASLIKRKEQMKNIDCFGLRECGHYGLKGTVAYFKHAENMRDNNNKIYSNEKRNEIYNSIFDVSNRLNNLNENLDYYLKLCLDIGALNVQILDCLDHTHNELFGQPEPTQVSRIPIKGKSILISGHDILDVYKILQQTENLNLNIYTHGELLPAHSYPKLKQFKHLIGHFGTAWQNQPSEFREFPGSILMTSNCLMPPRRKYKDRLFTSQAVGYEGLPHIKDYNYQPLIKKALELPGFDEEAISKWKDYKPFLTGFGHESLLSYSDVIINGIKTGKLNHLFVIGGCDGTEKSRSYFTDLASATPKDSVILTLGCGKYRLTNLDLGNWNNTNIPRILDVGQCNDAYSAVVVALKLADALGCKPQDLPLHFAVSWFEQKAVAVFLSLLHLGMKNIRLGPALPAFITPNVLKYLSDNLGVKQVNMEDEMADLEQMLANK